MPFISTVTGVCAEAGKGQHQTIDVKTSMAASNLEWFELEIGFQITNKLSLHLIALKPMSVR
jgi:hypothetical protein